MTQRFPPDKERERFRTNEEICNQSYRFSTRRHFRRVNWRCRLVSVTPAVRADTRPQPGEIIANPHPAPPARPLARPPARPPALLVHSQAEKCWYQTAQAALLRDPSCQESFHGSPFPLPFPPWSQWRGEEAWKASRECVCVCVRTCSRLSLPFSTPPPLIFCDSIASVWVCAASWPTEGCESVCRSFSCILREENTAKKKKSITDTPGCLVALWLTSYFKTACAFKKGLPVWQQYIYFFFPFFGGAFWHFVKILSEEQNFSLAPLLCRGSG